MVSFSGSFLPDPFILICPSNIPDRLLILAGENLRALFRDCHRMFKMRRQRTILCPIGPAVRFSPNFPVADVYPSALWPASCLSSAPTTARRSQHWAPEVAHVSLGLFHDPPGHALQSSRPSLPSSESPAICRSAYCLSLIHI